MSQIFRLFWLRETGCDAGTPLRAGSSSSELEVRIRGAGFGGGRRGELMLSLPYLDQREWRKRGEILAGLAWERCGNAISAVLPPAWRCVTPRRTWR